MAPRRTPALPLIALLASTPALAAPPGRTVRIKQPAVVAGAPRPVTTVEGITEYALDNGLRVLLFPDASKPTVTVNVTYFVGSRHEGYGESGMAHLLEHMVFKGTPSHPDVWKALQDHGAQFNGSTWVDRTNYFETLAATPENLKFAIELEADRMVNSTIANEALQKEFTVVRNEFERGENSPTRILNERMLSVAYQWHNYGKTTIGSRSDIERVPVDNLREFYRRFYQPDNAMLVVAGKFDPASTLELIRANFGKIPRPARQLNRTYTVEPVQDGERNVLLRRNGDVGVVSLLYHGVAGAAPEFVAEEALVDALTNRPAGRLYKALVDKGLAARVNGDALSTAEPGWLHFDAMVSAPTEQKLADVQAKMIGLVEGLAKSPITEEEVKRWRTATLADFDLLFTDPGRIGIELSEWAATGDWRTIFLHRDRVEKLTAADVNAFAQGFLKRANRTVGLFVPDKQPERSPLPEHVDVAAMVKDYKGRAPVKEGEAFVATPENIDQRTELGRLSNGMKLALLEKRTRGESVRLLVRVHAGDEQALAGKGRDAASLIPSFLLRGTKSHSYQQLQDELDRLKAEVRPLASGGHDAGSGGFRVLTTRQNLPAVVKLLAEILRRPAFAPTEFDVLKKELVTSLEQQLQEPQALALALLNQKAQPYPPTDVRYQPTVAERLARLKAVTRDDVAAWYTAHWGGSDGEIAVIGDFDKGELKTLLETELGAWKSPKPFHRVTRNLLDNVAAVEESIRTPDKPMAFVGIAQALALKDDDADFAAVRMVNYLLGGSSKSRLLDRLRQKDGLSYGAFSGVQADPFDRVGGLVAGAICARENAPKAMKALLEEVQRLLADGVNDAELTEAKKGYRQTFETNIASDDYVVSQLAHNLYVGRRMDYWAKLNARVAGLSKADVDAAARKYITPARFVRVLAGDLAAAAPTK